MPGRLFTFGCSFTRYCWPTWADILFAVREGENWALPGGGNKFIFASLMECMVTNKITAEDTVIMMWSSWAREDRYLNNAWQLHGNVYNNDFYTEDFLMRYWDDTGAALDSYNYKTAAYTMLEQLGCEYIMASGFEPTLIREAGEDFSLKVDGLLNSAEFEKYQTHLAQYSHRTIDQPLCDHKYCSDYVFRRTNWSNKPTGDSHPLPQQSHAWLRDNVLDRLNLTASERQTIDQQADKLHRDCVALFEQRDGQHPTVCDYPELAAMIMPLPKRI